MFIFRWGAGWNSPVGLIVPACLEFDTRDREEMKNLY